MKNKWASCSTRGLVSFSTELLEEDQKFGEYVIVHELLHLKIPNHGKLFKSLLRAYLPVWKARFDEKMACGISAETPARRTTESAQ
jgi:predicted metal-dependent hydrolase